MGAATARAFAAAFLPLLLLVVPASAADALRGIALAIGQSDYDQLSDLDNPERDADSVEQLFGRLGFDATATTNRDARRLTRDLEGFLDDAENADVAVLYYAGHAVEIGGENYLLPTDADASSPEALAEKLIPLSDTVRALQKRVPVTIVLLDACRNNPFPPGTTVRLSPDAEPVIVSDQGLQSRGVVALTQSLPSADENFGIVVAFSAEPGKVALDGTPGTNSPYAAALLRHLAAMPGEEFGTVMRMVAEEVYLKTGGQQRPWVNESLRRLLYFGEPAPDPSGDEGAILRERRQLLLTIAALPDIGRRQVERVATDRGVPMDAVYGMLKALGQDAPSDPGRLDAMLREQSQRLSEIMAQRSTLTQSDPEIVRLAALSGTAIAEGALGTAISLNEKAKQRVAELSTSLDDIESELMERRLEFARVYAESAAAYELTFDFRAAAADYDRAFAEASRWDDRIAWDYHRRALIAKYRHGEYRGDATVLQAIIADRDRTLRLADRLPSPVAGAEALLQIGNAENVLGAQRSDVPLLERAVADYEQAIAVFEAHNDAFGLSRARNNLASALTTLGTADADTARLDRAVAIHRELAAAAPFEASTVEWMTARLNLAAALSQRGERSGDTAMMREAMAMLSETVERVPPDAEPIQWALTKFNLGGTMLFVGEREGNPKMLADSVKAGEDVLTIFSRDAFPLYWASVHNNIGNAYQALGFGMDDATFFAAAEYEYRDALAEWRRDRVPDDWAKATNNLANVVKKLGDKNREPGRLQEAIGLYRDCLLVWTRAANPLSWASIQNNMGDAFALLGTLRKDATNLTSAIAAFDAALEEWTRERVPYDWSVAINNRGGALIGLGTLTASAETIRRGIADVEAAWKYDRDSGENGYDAYYTARVEAAKAELAKIETP